MTPTIDRDEFLRRCGSLATVLAERAEEGEALRRLPDATVDDARAADLLQAVVATSLGGHGLGLSALAHGARVMG